MMNSLFFLITVGLFLFPSSGVHAQQGEAPVYKDGDWWKVKVEITHKGGASRSGVCQEMYPEYIVKIEQGKAKVFGVSGDKQEEIECPLVESQLLDSGLMRRGLLQFPLSVGKAWEFRYESRTAAGRFLWQERSSKVIAWEKVRLPREEFDAFKIESVIRSNPQFTDTVYYAPKARVVILLRQITSFADRTVTLVDFNVSR